jgi:hypothetical protein
MNKSQKQSLCEEIDQYLERPKRLFDKEPIWGPSSRTNHLDARWSIEEEGGIIRSMLVFRHCRISTNEPSVSLIYEKKLVCRVDVKSDDEMDANPMQAQGMGLPAMVYGSHIHRWQHNKKYIIECLTGDAWEVPIKEEISNSAKAVGHILPLICDECNIEFTPEQRDFSAPPKSELI